MDQQLSSTELIMEGLWREVLQGIDSPGPMDNFFALGGDSISMSTLLYRITEEFSVTLPANALFDAPSMREISTLVDAAQSGKLA